MHRGRSVTIRDRDDITVDLYVVAYGDETRLSLDIVTPAGPLLIELSATEVTDLQAQATRLLGGASSQGRRATAA